MPTPSYREEPISQIPALQLLMAMGWKYLTPVEALALRGGKKSAVVLTGMLESWLVEHNSIVHKGQRYAFSEGNIREALRRLVDLPPAGCCLPTSTSTSCLRWVSACPRRVVPQRFRFHRFVRFLIRAIERLDDVVTFIPTHLDPQSVIY